MNIQELNLLCERMEGERGINPRHIYCIQTGAPIGTMDVAERLLAVDMIRASDDEELMDDLEIRTILSMRPSIVWNSLDSRSVNRLRHLAPRQLLSYLLIRCYEPRNPNGNLKMTTTERITAYRARIQMWRLVEFMPVSDERIKELTHVLLSIDAMFNLNSVGVNSTFPAPATITGDEPAKLYIEKMWKWYDSLFTAKEKADRENKLSEQYWSRGNSVTRDAAVKSTVEQKPRSESTIKKTAKKQADNEMLNLLQSIMDAASKGEPSPVEIESKPEPKPAIVMKPGALKLRFAGRK